MILPSEIMNEVDNYFADIKEYNYNADYIELKNHTGKKNYQLLLCQLSKLELPDLSTITFTQISLSALKALVTELLTSVLGCRYQSHIKHYNSLLHPENIEAFFDETTETALEHGIRRPISFHISKHHTSIQIPTIAHEYIHGLLARYETALFNQHLKNIHYTETLSILVEYIICYELSKILTGENIMHKHEVLRITQDKNQALELQDCKAFLTELARYSPEDAISLKKYINFQRHNSYSYILSNIYAEYLISIYHTKPEDILNFIRSIIDGTKSIDDLIHYFKLSLHNSSVIDEYNQALKRVTLTKHL